MKSKNSFTPDVMRVSHEHHRNVKRFAAATPSKLKKSDKSLRARSR
jgi:hypothetical protein